MEEFYDVLADATILAIIKGEGGWTVVGKVWHRVETDEVDDPVYQSALRNHVCTSEAEVVRRVKHYLRENLSSESGSVE